MRLSETFQRHHVYGKSGIVVDELLLGRRYGGVAIFVNKNIKCFISEVDVKVKECALFCVNLMNILFYLYQFTCYVMREKNLDEYIYILGVIIVCQIKVKANYIIIGGDWNTDLQRCHSNSTIALNDMCTEQDLTCVSSVYDIDFTYVSDVNGTYSTIDHFIVSNSLNTGVNNYCIVNNIDNMSDHLPLCMYSHLPVNIMYF